MNATLKMYTLDKEGLLQSLFYRLYVPVSPSPSIHLRLYISVFPSLSLHSRHSNPVTSTPSLQPCRSISVFPSFSFKCLYALCFLSKSPQAGQNELRSQCWTWWIHSLIPWSGQWLSLRQRYWPTTFPARAKPEFVFTSCFSNRSTYRYVCSSRKYASCWFWAFTVTPSAWTPVWIDSRFESIFSDNSCSGCLR